jgi:uncharacterized protein
MHPNEAIVREGYDAFVRGDIEAVANFLDPDVLWHVEGTSPLAGTYKGHDELRAFFFRVVEMTGGTVTIAARDIIANDDNVIVLTTMKAKRDDKELDDDGVAVFRIRDGKAVEVWNFAEHQGALDSFFS